MRRFWRAMTCALGLAILATQAPAQTYPAKPVRIIVPYAPGGLTDVVARLYSEQLRQRLGRSVFVENKPGASGIIAIEEMARARPDGHTLMIGNISTNALTPVLLAKKMKLDYEREVQIVAPLADVPVFFLATTTEFPPRNFGEFLAYAREHPGKVRYGSAGVGSYQQINIDSSPNAPVSTSCTFHSRAAAPRSCATSATAISRCRGSTSPIRLA
jgi:tripartite-type tricarboxylate transporter receptor subunit TctC